MPVLISDIKIPLTENQDRWLELACKVVGVTPEAVEKAWIYRRSLDARRRDRIYFQYTVGLSFAGEHALPPNPYVKPYNAPRLQWQRGGEKLASPPVVVGFGPGGMFCGLVLARMGLSPIILERGQPMDKRVAAVESFFAGGPLDENSNVQFGEGGAGTFSDGKLTTRIGDPASRYVLEQLVAFGAPEEILWQAKPHIGTDKLRMVVQNLREEIQSLGGEIRFNTKLEQIHTDAGRITGITAGGDIIQTTCLVLAVGHSARDTFAMLSAAGLDMTPKPFSVGFRVEHLQETIDRGLYGEFAGHPNLPAGEYQLSHRDKDGRGVYTFCMCPGGVVVPAASEAGGIVTNGMSRHARDGKNANSALVVNVDTADFGSHPLDGVAFQQRLEQLAFTGDYRAPAQTAGLFLAGKPGLATGSITPSYAMGVYPGDFAAMFPPAVTRRLRQGLGIFGRRLRGFDTADAILTGPETRTSSPLRILRDDTLESTAVRGLFPCGEGAGYAGGIMSAACDGIRIAGKILENYGG